jgi:hypothetical protein
MAFLNEKDQTLLRYPDIGGLFRGTVNVQILPDAAGIEKLSGLVMLSWYLVVMMHRDSGTAAATTAAMG